MKVGPSAGIEPDKPAKQPPAAAVKSRGGERRGKRLGKTNHVWRAKMNENELLTRCRNHFRFCQNLESRIRQGQGRGNAGLLPAWQTAYRRHECATG